MLKVIILGGNKMIVYNVILKTVRIGDDAIAQCSN